MLVVISAEKETSMRSFFELLDKVPTKVGLAIAAALYAVSIAARIYFQRG